MARKRETTIERAGFSNYDVTCGKCGEEFTVSMYPEYCVACGAELQPPKRKEKKHGND
jgi:ribosomal protein S27E